MVSDCTCACVRLSLKPWRLLFQFCVAGSFRLGFVFRVKVSALWFDFWCSGLGSLRFGFRVSDLALGFRV